MTNESSATSALISALSSSIFQHTVKTSGIGKRSQISLKLINYKSYNYNNL